MTSSPTVVNERSAVPFFDPSPSFAELKSKLIAEISELIDSGAFINGPQVGAFETAFARILRRRPLRRTSQAGSTRCGSG